MQGHNLGQDVSSYPTFPLSPLLIYFAPSMGVRWFARKRDPPAQAWPAEAPFSSCCSDRKNNIFFPPILINWVISQMFQNWGLHELPICVAMWKREAMWKADGRKKTWPQNGFFTWNPQPRGPGHRRRFLSYLNVTERIPTRSLVMTAS